MQAKDIPDRDVLEYLADRQGEWTCIWYGHFIGAESREHPPGSGIYPWKDEPVSDVYLAMPRGTPEKVALAKMRSLYRRDLVGGCDCGCRGDFEITDKGLALIGRARTKPYTGY